MKLKSIIGLVLVPVCIVMLCIGSACADEPIPDYSAETLAIVTDNTLTDQEKADAQCALFGWDIRLKLWDMARQYDYVQVGNSTNGTEPEYEFVESVNYSSETIGSLIPIYNAGLAAERAGQDFHWYTLEEGRAAYQRYVEIYCANYRSWDT